jgi:hypothetical protein
MRTTAISSTPAIASVRQRAMLRRNQTLQSKSSTPTPAITRRSHTAAPTLIAHGVASQTATHATGSTPRPHAIATYLTIFISLIPAYLMLSKLLTVVHWQRIPASL